jgi:hypothetical protein
MQLGSRPQGSSGGSGSYNNPAAAKPATAPAPEAPAQEIPTINLDEEENEVKIEDVPF